MRRREFIRGLGTAAAAWPLPAYAQQAGRLPTIGILGSAAAGWGRLTAAFIKRLHELGYIEDRTIAIEYRWAQEHNEPYGRAAAELVRRKVDIIVAIGTPAIIAAKQTTAVIPIVFPLASNPIGDGLVASLARPGGNVTGLSNQQRDLVGKRVELLREVVPGLRRVAILANVSNRVTSQEIHEVQEAVRKLGFEVGMPKINSADDIAPVIEALKGNSQAIYVVGDPFVIDSQNRINALAQAARLPTIYGERGYIETGGLVSYGPSFADLFRRAADYVDKILKGAKPADIPVEQPTKIELVVNRKTANAIGLTIPEVLLVRADEIIE